MRELLAHPEDTAGGLMTSRFIAVTEDMSAAQTIEQVRAWAEDEDEVFYLYLTDQEGLLSALKRLLLASTDAPVGTLANRSPIAVRSDMDQGEIAYIFAEYDLLVLPVVLAAVMGAVVPLVFRRIGVDPAVVSGPLITTLNDGLSLMLYFGIAAFFL